MKTHIIPTEIEEEFDRQRAESEHCGKPAKPMNKKTPEPCTECGGRGYVEGFSPSGCPRDFPCPYCRPTTITPQADSVKPLGTTLEDPPDLAWKIAMAIMSQGDEPGSPCGRIQFMGGIWGVSEKPQGGMIVTPLATLIRSHIHGLLSDCEALNDEIEHQKAITRRAHTRAVEISRRLSDTHQALGDLIYAATHHIEIKGNGSKADMAVLEHARKVFKGQP